MRSKLPFPHHILSPVTGAKNFQTNPVLGSRLLNRLGLHGLRYLLAHLVMRVRWLFLLPLMPRDMRGRFHRDGYVAVEGFLTAEALDTLRTELAGLTGDVRRLAQGDTFTERMLLDKPALAGAPTLNKVARDPRLKNWVGYAGGRWRRPLLYLQRIRNGARAGDADPQKTLHSDTFHPTVKAWLFLEDVTPDKGPFTYVPGSHRLTRKRLAFEYRTSLTAKDSRNGYTEKGSFRMDESARKAMGLPPAKSLCVKAGTLVIANTHGFHGRGQAASGATRAEIWAYSRFTPFLPWPGLGIDWPTTLAEWMLPQIWRHRDREAAKQGRRASWHRIASDDFLKDRGFTAATDTDKS